MRRRSATAILAFALSSSPLLAQADEHAGHHPESAAPVPDTKTPPPADDKSCPMIGGMKSGSGPSAMQGNMPGKGDQNMDGLNRDAGGPADQHQH